MSMKTLSLTLLLLVGVVFCAGSSRHVPKKGSCCEMITNADVANSVIGDTYIHKPLQFPCMEIILLTTQKGQVCVNPKADWVKRLIANMTKRP